MFDVLAPDDERVSGSRMEGHHLTGRELDRRTGRHDRIVVETRSVPCCDDSIGDRLVLVPEARPIAGADVLVSPLLEGGELLIQNIAGDLSRRDVRALISAEYGRRLVRSDEASRKLFVLHELQVLPLAELVRHRNTRRGSRDSDAALDVTGGDERDFGVVLGGDDLRARLTVARFPSVDDDVLLRPRRDGQEKRRRAHEAARSAERVHRCSAHRSARLQMERRADSSVDRGDVGMHDRNDACWTSRVVDVVRPRARDGRVAIGKEEDDTFTRGDRAGVLDE